MNGGHSEFFVKQSVRDTRKSFRIASKGKFRACARKALPRIHRSLRLEESEPTQDTIGPVLVIMLAIPLIFYLGYFLHVAVPGAVLLAGTVMYFYQRRRARRLASRTREV